jgi:hypothetical protein
VLWVSGRVLFGKLGFGFASIFVNVGVLGFLEGKELGFRVLGL